MDVHQTRAQLTSPDDALTHVLRESPSTLQVLQHISIPVWIFDVNRLAIVWGNLAAINLWGATSLAALRERDFSTDMSLTVRRRLQQYCEDFYKNLRFSELWTLYPRGKPQTYHCSFSGIVLADGSMAMMVQAVAEEVSSNEASLRSTQALLHTSVMITLYDWDGQLLYCNPAARTQFGARHHRLDEHLNDAARFKELRHALSSNGRCRDELEVHTTVGLRWHELRLQRGLDPVSGAPTILVSETDVTERRQAEQLANRLANSDTLTGLPNRKLLLERLEAELSRAERCQQRLAVLFLDLDRFKQINDSLGHMAGDQLLIEVAQRLSACVSDHNTVARLSGDEFVAIVSGAADSAENIARRMLQYVTAPINYQDQALYVSTSIGISMFPSDGSSALELINNADIAMYHAKAEGHNRYRLFTANMATAARAKLQAKQL